jgi:hypothetical protein
MRDAPINILADVDGFRRGMEQAKEAASALSAEIAKLPRHYRRLLYLVKAHRAQAERSAIRCLGVYVPRRRTIARNHRYLKAHGLPFAPSMV